MLYQVLVGRSLLSRSLVITKVTKINENQGFLRILMKSMDFKTLDVAIITRSRLQTIEQLIPPRKWTFPKRLRKFETYFHVISGFGRSFLTIEIASHRQSHQSGSNCGPGPVGSRAQADPGGASLLHRATSKRFAAGTSWFL